MTRTTLADRIADKLVTPAAFMAVLSIGDTFRVRNRLYHVRGRVDDMLVCRHWRKAKRRWEYEVLDEAFFAAFFRGPTNATK